MGRQSLVKFEEKIEWRRSRKKKNHARNFEIWALPLNQRGAIMVGSTLIQWQRSNFKITGVVFFYGSLFLLTEPKFHSCLTLRSNNSRSKPHTPNKFHIFGIVRTSAFRWTYPGFFFLWANFEEQAFYEKRLFFAFLHDRTEKIFKWPPIGQYWRQRASQ